MAKDHDSFELAVAMQAFAARLEVLAIVMHEHPRQSNWGISRKHCEATLATYGFPRSDATSEFTSLVGILATCFGLSLRDVERGVIFFSIAQPVTAFAMEFAWPIALKPKWLDLFRRLLSDEAAAHGQAYKLAADLAAGESGVDRVLTFLAERHNSGYTGFKNSLPQGAGLDDSAMSRIRGPKAMLQALFRRIDVSVTT
ncbi:MAG: hypothetical protein IPP44_24830 [Ideonella sp.]|nr:hypothetical protein [Ideonella sp.]